VKFAIIHFVVVVIWVLLRGEFSALSLGVGWLLGLVLLLLMRPIVGGGAYFGRLVGAARFAAVFSGAFLASCGQIVRLCLGRGPRRLNPRMMTYDVRGLGRIEVLLLAHCISLTPGTTTVDVDLAGGRLLLHALDAPDPEAVRQEIDRSLRRAVLGLTRGLR